MLTTPTTPIMPIPSTRSSPPSLSLDKRQRAMLRDMGIRLWLPRPDAVAAPAESAEPALATSAAILATAPPALRDPAVSQHQTAPESIAEKAVKVRTGGPFDQKNAVLTADAGMSSALTGASPTWQFATPHALYADAPPGEDGPRWLVQAETPAAALQASDFHPFDGEAGKLLDNMLRATRLAAPGRVVLVPMCRQLPGDAAVPGASLAELVATHQPHLLLVMGRLAAQALLQTTEPLGKLRGRVHTLHGVKTIVTYDAQPLLRTPADKAKAWDDLCLGMVEAATIFKPA